MLVAYLSLAGLYARFFVGRDEQNLDRPHRREPRGLRRPLLHMADHVGARLAVRRQLSLDVMGVDEDLPLCVAFCKGTDAVLDELGERNDRTAHDARDVGRR